MDQFLTVATFNERQPADRLCEHLRGAGFDADVYDESGAQKWLLLNMEPKAHMRVRVQKEEGEKALSQLKTWQETEPAVMEGALHCPQCSSSRIEYPQFSRRTLMSALPAAAAAVGLIEKEFYCEACGFTWDPNVKVEPPRDVLNWPTESGKAEA